MAQYFTDFSEYTTDAAPSDWTLRYGTRAYTVKADAGATGGKLLQITGASDMDFFTWNDLDADADRDDSEVLFRFRFLTAAAEIRALQRGVTDSGREGYILGARPDTSTFNVSAFSNGGFVDLTTESTGASLSTSTWYFCSAIVRGASQELRVWADGASRPAGVSSADPANSGITLPGWIGLYSNRSATIEVDWFSVGTGLDDAPTSAPASDSITISPSTLTPGGAFTITYSGFAAIPVSPATLTDQNGNSITVAVTIDNTDTGGVHSGTATGTMPSLPSSGSQAGLMFSADGTTQNITVELTT